MDDFLNLNVAIKYGFLVKSSGCNSGVSLDRSPIEMDEQTQQTCGFRLIFAVIFQFRSMHVSPTGMVTINGLVVMSHE